MRKGLIALVSALALAACSVTPNGAESRSSSQPEQIASVLDTLSYPEGPLLVGGVLHVAEMGGDRIARIENGAPLAHWPLTACGPTALAPYGEGYVALCHLSGDLAVLDANGVEQRRIGPLAGVSIRNPNDGASDLRGGVYFSDPGDFYRPRQPVGRVVWLTPEGRLRTVAQGLNYPNGVYVVEDGAQRFAFVSEHFSRRILRYAINEDGSFGPQSVWATIPQQGPGARFSYDQAGPDGLERGPDGQWYVAIYGEGRVLRLDAEGAITGQFETPFQYVTNVSVTPLGMVFIVGPYVHDRAPFRGGMVQAPGWAFD
jgi:sugar lactone lactonase YvrE